jgi:hypothetical protein
VYCIIILLDDCREINYSDSDSDSDLRKTGPGYESDFQKNPDPVTDPALK